MSNQSRSNSAPLLPLEYCSPERAARLLGCEVEDIFHWATVGAITLFAEFYEYDFDAEISEGFYADVNYGMGIYDPEHLEWIPSNDGDFFYQLELEDNDDFEINIGPVGFQYGARLQISGSPRTILAEGLFAIDTASIQQWLHESPTEIPFRHWNISALYAGDNERDCYLNAIDLDKITVPDIPKRFRVVREDMLKIRDHMLSGELMPSHAIVRRNNNERASTVSNTPHPTAERKAINRERVLAAAIHARERWPDECRTATSWAETLVNHSMNLFGTIEPPYSHEHMARLLGRAMNDGQPYRKT
ncbi:TPA: hypothetical protein ACQJJO_002083 [Aeromonas veronii]